MAVSTIAIGVFGCVAWFWGSNWLLDRIYPPRGAQAGDNIRRANQIRPWLFLGPAILFLTTYLVYPVLDSFWRSLFNSNGSQFV
ncbi:alpha-glucoside ABC transporter permease, partial [Xylophilus sp. Kf1]|nr:alpha-glucoside ABC transporter permease [Xylophilus sp. Kf1]